ncbi:carboxypeptidase regulatory-like domain-containing protein [Haloarcula sp. CBA1130]|uniref:hypothetical protein n=1 Tax=unclassified Haloarcula TaxID=2624677 RepID=UPI001246A511|nr:MULTISPECIES: hypothetical protein [unclassified Haloarcula]KAA9396521.1 carboxypeptidase regulatory-like domain-containing protein [Haloarcula sp. CBA1130]KAA9397622.1 carboxypeptidase regulatory-like domain-containing protein [Haloarcula sp. CBA1129]
MSDPFEVAEFGRQTSRLSLAVRLVDRFTARTPQNPPRVRLEGRDDTPVETPSGYYVFLDLEAGTETLLVEGATDYVDSRVTGVEVIDLGDPDTTVEPTELDTLPLETVYLAPSPAYRFPNGTTLVRGTVSGPGGDPLPTARLRVQDGDTVTRTEGGPVTRTDQNGEYVLFFDPVTAADVVDSSGRSVIELDGDPPSVVVDHTVHGEKTISLEDDDGDSIVEEGAVTVRDIGYP